MDNFLQKMGTRIMLRRKEMELTQEDVAEITGLTPQTISTAENGKKGLKPENIVKICTALKVTPNYLLLGTSADMYEETLPIRITALSTEHRVYLKNIVENYIKAVTVPGKTSE